MQDFAASKVSRSAGALNQLTCLLKSRAAARVMKLTGIILLAGCLQLSARGLTQTVSISVKDAPLLTVLKAIEKQTTYVFFVDNQWLQKAKKVTITANNVPLQKVLDDCFKDQPLTYSITGKVINITPKEEKASNVDLISTADPGDVKGRVVNENGEPVAATISVKGSNKATNTNDNGEFQLTGVDENATLIITGVGIESRELKLNGSNNLKVTVKISVTPLEETIIKGYYTTTRRLNTGSVSKITADEIQKQPINNPLAALEGRMPGVYIQQTTGIPGGAFNISIRGQNSLRNTTTNNGNQPLFIVDGVPFTSFSILSGSTNSSLRGGNPLSYINSSDIESVEVLKDADATSIYGSRGANGVVLITTKKGKIGKTKYDFDFYKGIGRISRKIDLLNTSDYLNMRWEAYKNDNAVPSINQAPDLLVWDTTRYTDWQEIFIGGTANITNAQASISGGNVNTQFLVGGNFYNETTVFPGSFRDRKGSIHLYLTHESDNKKFRITLSSNYVSDNSNLPQTDFTTRAISLPPDAPPIYDSSGKLNWANNTWGNPFADLKKQYKSNSDNIISSSLLSYKLFKGLQIKTNLGYTKLETKEITTIPISSNNPAFTSTGTSFFANSYIKTWIIEPQAEYQVNFGSGKLIALFGSTFQENIQEGQTIRGSGFTNDALIENAQAAPSVTFSSINYSQYRYSAVFGRLNYNWSDKYLINLTGRRDGSSRFGKDKQFANFGAVGVGWIFSNEHFIHNFLPYLSHGKVRISFGITGSDQIGDYGFMDTYSATAFAYQGGIGLVPTRLVNSDYSWEENKKFESAVEIGFIQNRILFTGSYYKNRSSNQLVGYSLPVLTGQSSIQYNLPATVQNTGYEFELNSTNIKTNKLLWSTAINISFTKNKLISYPNIEASSYANTYVVGEPLYIQKLYHYTGVDHQEGNYTFEDVDKDGKISFPNDLQALSKLKQDFFGGIQNRVEYKGFEFEFFFQFVKQTGRNYLYSFSTVPGTFGNQPNFVLNRWQQPGDETNIQRFTQNFGSVTASMYRNAQNSDYFITDASFIRLKNISLSYQLPSNWLKRLHVQNSRVFVQGQNTLTITKYLGGDPENQLAQALPPLRILTIGFHLTL